MCLSSDSYAQRGYAVAPHPTRPCRRPNGCTSFLSLAGCSATASTTPAAGPAIAAAPASTSSPGSPPLPTAQTNASVSRSWVFPSFSSCFAKHRLTTLLQPLDAGVRRSHSLEWWGLWCVALGEAEITGAARGRFAQWLMVLSRGSQGGPLGLSGTLILLMFRFLLRVPGFVQASLVAQFCLQDELHLDVFTYRTSLFA